MRLGILIYSLSGGGAERVVSYLLSYCDKNNIEVHLILMNAHIGFDLPDGLQVHYIEKSKAHENGVMKAAKIPVLAYKYSRLVEKLKITHSLSFLTRPAFINVLSSKITNHSFKVIVNERSFPSLQYGYKGFQSSFNKILIRKLYKMSHIIISNSFGNAADLVNNFEVPQQKVHVIHNPIDLYKINDIEPNLSFFDAKKFNIVTVGRLDSGKNLQLLIRALHQLKNPMFQLYIFGFGVLQETLQNLVDSLQLQDQVTFMGYDPNPYPYLKAADLFIFGSNHEGFPNVLLEAMACKLPILSTNCQSGPSEIMELKTEKNDLMITDYGILVPIKNIDLMAKGIVYFANNKKYLEDCKTNGQNRINDFEKDHILKAYLDLIVTSA